LEKFEGSASAAHICVSARIEHPGSAEHGVEKAAGALNRVIADALSRVPPEEAAVSAWPFVCGSNVARRAPALDFREHVLRVEVPDRAWRSQLMELAPRYLAVLNSMVPHRIERIQFLLPQEVEAEKRRAQ
jgi:hypothetical protein